MIRRQPAAEIFLVLFTSLFFQILRELETYSSALRVEIELEARVITLLPRPPFLNVKIFCFDVLLWRFTFQTSIWGTGLRYSHGFNSACPQKLLFQILRYLSRQIWEILCIQCVHILKIFKRLKIHMAPFLLVRNNRYFKCSWNSGPGTELELKKDDVQKWLSFLKNMADEKVNSSGWRSHWDLTRRQFPTKTRKAFRHNLFSQLVVTQNIRLSLERLVPFRRDNSRYHPPPQIVKSIENGLSSDNRWKIAISSKAV